MEKCFVVIIDTANNKNFNYKKIKNILCNALSSDSNPFDIKQSFLEKNVKFIEFDKDCDNNVIDEAMTKPHIFVNIIRSSVRFVKEVDIFDFDKSFKEQNYNSFHYRQLNVLSHAFTTRNKNALYIMVNDGGASEILHDNFESWIEINWFGFKTEICSDQLINIGHNLCYEAEIKKWLLLKLITFDGNFPFFCLPPLSKMISCYIGLVDMNDNTLYLNECISNTQECYSAMLTSLLSSLASSKLSDDFNYPVFLHGDGDVEWRVVKTIIHSQFSDQSNYIGHYQCRLHNLCQDINLLLVYILRFFKVFPQDDQLPFNTAQMATLVNDCLRTGSSVSKSKKTFIFIIEDIDWVSSTTLAGQTCSWLPEKCAPNIHVIMTSNNDSLQQKSLKARLSPPIFIDLSFPKLLICNLEESCGCTKQWCISRILRCEDTLRSMLVMADHKGLSEETLIILSIFYCSLVCSLTRSQIEFLVSFSLKKSQNNLQNLFDEKGEIENSEKSVMESCKAATLWPRSDHTKTALSLLVETKVLCRLYLRGSSEATFSLSVPQLRLHIAPVIFERMQPSDLEMIKCYIGALLVYHSTDFHDQMLFVPETLQYLPAMKDSVLKDWLLSWTVLTKFSDEYSVPIKLLSLWRSILGLETDYIPMLNAYISLCLPNLSVSLTCFTCQSLITVPLKHGRVCLDMLLQPTIDLSKKTTRRRCRILLELARLAMQVGQYSAAKDIGRVLLKLLSHSASEKSLLTMPGPDKNLLASSLHLLFSTLDERLKTFEFVTEQTTPIFRRTVHYGSRALLLQNSIVEQLQRTVNKQASFGSGDSEPSDLEMLLQKLCFAEIRLARIMAHFVFSLDGVEQTAINRHFLPSKIKVVTWACMTRAYEIATRLRDRSLLLEIQMTFGVIQPRENCKEKIMLYKTPLRQALCTYGQSHIFVSRIYINIAISYEEQKKYIKAFEYFTLWSHITHELLGRSHCKSVRSCGVFKEPIFKLTAEFIEYLNGESSNDFLEEELVSNVGHVAEDVTDSGENDLSVEGVRIINPPEIENVSLENMFAFRSSLEQETDWEIHSSDDETPNYTTAFEEVITTFQKKSSSTMSRDLLHSFLDSSVIDSEDLTKDDINILYESHEASLGRLSALNRDSQNYEGSVVEAIQISRVFRGLQDLTRVFPNASTSSSELNLARRLLELQRDLQDFLNN